MDVEDYSGDPISAASGERNDHVSRSRFGKRKQGHQGRQMHQLRAHAQGPLRVGAKLQDRHVRLLLRKPAESVSEVLHRGCGYLGAEADCAYSPIPRPAGFAGFTRRA